jgi:hypothetical protein
MNVIPISHLALVRARKNMEKAFDSGDWDAVRKWDSVISQELNEAFDDSRRDHALLASELEKILGLYSLMTRCLPEATAEQWLRPESLR